MDSKTANELLAHLAPIAQGNAQLIQAATSILSQVSEQARGASDSGIVVREQAPIVETQALPHDPKAPSVSIPIPSLSVSIPVSHSIPTPSPENDALAEQIMAELERVESKGMTPRDLGKKVQAQVPGKPSVPPHQRYRFRTVMQLLVTEKRIARLDADDPKKLRYVTSIFVPESK